MPMAAVQNDVHVTTITVRNPADGTEVGRVPVDGPELVAEKASRLREAQAEWEDIGPRGRRRWLLDFQGLDPRQRRPHHRRSGIGDG
jgi:acyl-CoA reductase-like NAD-dependent aldehyde dehydrogenase